MSVETENATLNVKLKMWWWWLWMPKLKSDNDGFKCQNQKCNNDGFERQNWKLYNDPECRTTNMAPNTKLRRNGGFERQTKNNSMNAKQKQRLWTLMITMNVKMRKTTLNVVNEKTRWLWKPSWKGVTLNAVNRECMVVLNARIARKWWRGGYAPV